MTQATPTLQQQITEAELHACGLHDLADRFAGSKKRSDHDVVRRRERAVVADAIVETLKRLAATDSQGVLP